MRIHTFLLILTSSARRYSVVRRTAARLLARGGALLLLCALLLLFASCQRYEEQATNGSEPTPAVAAQPTAGTPTPRGPAAQPAEASGSAADRAESVPRTPTAPAQARLSQPTETAPPRPLDSTINVLVLGSDRRPHMPNWRTDVIMVVAMDLEGGEAGVISIPRDIYLDRIPNHSPNRINVVDYLGEQDEPDGGGPQLLATLIAQNMGIPIHHYLRFDFTGFEQAVDALGGLEITLDCPVSDLIPEEGIAIRLQPGVHRLDGNLALDYVRTRRQGGDLERTRRQQRVLWAVRDQIRRENLLPRLPSLYWALRDDVQTDINLARAIRYARFALGLEEEEVHSMVIAPPDLLTPSWRGGMSVFVADWPQIRARVQTLFDGPPLQASTSGGAENNSADAENAAPPPQCP